MTADHGHPEVPHASRDRNTITHLLQPPRRAHSLLVLASNTHTRIHRSELRPCTPYLIPEVSAPCLSSQTFPSTTFPTPYPQPLLRGLCAPWWSFNACLSSVPPPPPWSILFLRQGSYPIHCDIPSAQRSPWPSRGYGWADPHLFKPTLTPHPVSLLSSKRRRLLPPFLPRCLPLVAVTFETSLFRNVLDLQKNSAQDFHLPLTQDPLLVLMPRLT